MKIKDLIARLQDIEKEEPEATVGVLTYTDGFFNSSEIYFITKQVDKYVFDYLIQP